MSPIHVSTDTHHQLGEACRGDQLCSRWAHLIWDISGLCDLSLQVQTKSSSMSHLSLTPLHPQTLELSPRSHLQVDEDSDLFAATSEPLPTLTLRLSLSGH